ncbi:MAG: hypothetical protein ABH851_09480 [Methanobacteriota archaeon]
MTRLLYTTDGGAKNWTEPLTDAYRFLQSVGPALEDIRRMPGSTGVPEAAILLDPKILGINRAYQFEKFYFKIVDMPDRLHHGVRGLALVMGVLPDGKPTSSDQEYILPAANPGTKQHGIEDGVYALAVIGATPKELESALKEGLADLRGKCGELGLLQED